MILVVSHSDDDHAAVVLAVLAEEGREAVLVDTGRFPSALGLVERFGDGPPRYSLVLDGRAVDLSTCRAAWWRRPRPFTLAPSLAEDAYNFAYGECAEALGGLWSALEASWVNPPAADETAHHKPYQLAVAGEVGLSVPRTLVTNDPSEARAFARALGPGRTIYKTFLATESHWRETRFLLEEEMALLDNVRLAPVIFQEFVPATVDLRVTVVGDDLFATAITPAPGGYHLDYRMDLPGATFSPTVLPDETEKQLRALMDRLGLVYGAIDLRRTPEGGYVFLEVNPSGEWLFVEERSEQPITAAMASLLGRLDRR